MNVYIFRDKTEKLSDLSEDRKKELQQKENARQLYNASSDEVNSGIDLYGSLRNLELQFRTCKKLTIEFALGFDLLT